MGNLIEALTNRRDITHMRETQHHHEPPQSPTVVDFGRMEHTLERVLKELQTEPGPATLCVTDREPAQGRLKNFPLPGITRFLIRRSGEGGDYVLAQNTPVLVLEAAEYRLGSYIVNIGANLVKLYLSVDLQGVGGNFLSQGVPIVGLPANAIWPGKIEGSLIPWCGNVTAVCTVAGGSEVTVAAF